MVDIGDVGGALLEPFQSAMEYVGKTIDLLGSGVEWTGEQIQEFADLVAQLADKVDALQAQARGD